ncbi:MAG: glycosyltransferase family 4 protein [Nanobdellota archaeon]
MKIISMYGKKQGTGGIESLLSNQKGFEIQDIWTNEPDPESDEAAEDIFNQFYAALPADLLHIHSPNIYAGYVAAMVAKEEGIPSIATFHYGGYTNWPHLQEREEMMQDTFNIVDHIICVSKASQEAIEKENSSVIYNGIEPSQFYPMEKNRDQGNDLRIIYPAKICHSKGQKDLVYIGQKLLQEGVPFEINLVGKNADPRYRYDLETDIKEKELSDYIHIHKPVPLDKMNELYNKHNLLIFPSKMEGLGLISLEAQAVGIPVVLYDSGGMKETIIENETGFSVEYNDTYALFERSMQLYHDPNLRREMGRRGIINVKENFTIEQMLHQQKTLYERMIKGH